MTRMKVVIVAKTRQGSGACIGGLTFDGRSVRLIAADAEQNELAGLEYHLGDVWEVEWAPAGTITPPHTENIVVFNKRKLPPLEDLPAFIQHHSPPFVGPIQQLYDGLTQTTESGALYIAQHTGIPNHSTTFWQPDQPLHRETQGKRIRYRYGNQTLVFVGFQEPLPVIEAGSLLRVSLAHWWQPRDKPQTELRCYVQLSGWILPPNDDFGPPAIEDDPETEDAPPLSPHPALNMESAKHLLKTVFGYDDFRPLQAEIIANILNKRDTLAIMPTGSGKSLCFQLPALLFSGLTVVVSPLISLMQDQVEQLQDLGVAAAYLNSTLAYHDYLATTQRIRHGQIKLLYVAPETLLRPETLLLLTQCPVECLTIDEAHCISEWGHDFRPEYRRLAEVRQRLPQAVCLAVTATATEQVRRDMKQSLNIGSANEFIASFDRDNLFLAVEPRTDGLSQILAFLETHREESGIIYCNTRQQVEKLTAQLRGHGWPVLPYHAGLADATRQNNQRQFSQDDVPIMVATVAFGMGINKSNVRFVIHYELPKNLESYYQQIGRSGRDGLQADCLLLYAPTDVQTVNFFIQQQEPARQKVAQAQLQAMLGFVESNLCRRRPLLAYFNENYPAERCDLCDNCHNQEENLADLTIPAQKFLSCVKRTRQLFGLNHIIDVLRGSKAQTILQRGHEQLSTYNIGSEFSRKEWQFLARQFIQQGLLAQDMEHGSLKLTDKGYGVMKGQPVHGKLPGRERATSQLAPIPYDQTLFELLRNKRKSLAQAANVPPYIILSDRSLLEMATYFPHSPNSLRQLYGLGQFKVEKYGETFLTLIKTYCQDNHLSEKPKIVIANGSRKNRTEEVIELYNDGRTIPDLAQFFMVKQATIIDHLYKGVTSGREMRQSNLLELSQLSPAQQQQALEQFATIGPDRLKPIFEALAETIPYDELHLLRLHLLLQANR